MTAAEAPLSLPGVEGAADHDGDNITDWCLEQFRGRYDDPSITKDDIWEYLYGVMHAPDWRERYQHDLRRSLPRVPLADDFEAFRSAGRRLIDLHIGYDNADEHLAVVVEVDGDPDDGSAQRDAYRIEDKMRWGRGPDGEDRTVLRINSRCRLLHIPARAHSYKISGRSPLAWAVDTLQVKTDKESGTVDDPNSWGQWADRPFELIRHMRRLVTVCVETAEIVEALPPSLPPQQPPANAGQDPRPRSDDTDAHRPAAADRAPQAQKPDAPPPEDQAGPPLPRRRRRKIRGFG